MLVVFTNKNGMGSGLELIPETKTESDYLCDLDRDMLRPFLDHRLELIGLEFVPVGVAQPTAERPAGSKGTSGTARNAGKRTR
jgi:hypothetical protein